MCIRLGLFISTSLSAGTTLNYAWNFGDGFTSTDQDPVHLFLNPGNFLETLTVYSQQGCSSSVSKNISIYQVPVTNYSVANVCDTIYANFLNLSTIASGTLTYVWSFGDGNSSFVTNPNYLYGGIGTYTTKLISSSAQGCTDTLIKSVTIYPRPVVNFLIPAVCYGFTSLFTDASTIASGTISTYLWDFGDGTNSIVANPSKQYLNPGTF